MPNMNEITPIINHLKKSKLKSLIADNSLKIIWCSDSRDLLGASLYSVFEENFVIPDESCTCKGVLHGIPYYYNIIKHDNFYVVEIMSDNMLSDITSNTIPDAILKKAEIEIRSSVANICTHTSILYDIMKNIKCTHEIDHLNLQRGNCYKILNTISTPVEVSRYSHPECYRKSPVSIQEIFEEFESDLNIIGNSNRLKFISEKNIFINAHKERFTNVLIELISKFAEVKSIQATVSAEKIDGFIYISIRREGVTPAHEGYKLFEDADGLLYNSKIDFILTNLFCRYFSAEFYLNKISDKIISCTLKIPMAVPDKSGLTFRSAEKQYGSDSFSPIRLAFSTLYDYRYYKIPDFSDD